MADTSFITLLYRYFFFGWLFMDARHGKRHERAVAWRHNVRQARWLPLYMKRWLALCILFYLSGLVCELHLQAPVLSACFFVPVAAGMSVNAVIGALMIGLKCLPAPQ